MKDKLIYKMLIVVMLVFFIISVLSINVYAAAKKQEVGGSSGSSSSSGSDNFDLEYYNSGNASDESLSKPVSTFAGVIINAMRIISVGVALIMLAVLAIKYMMAAPTERAEVKKSAVQYAIGAVVLFATSGILTIIQNFVNTALPE